MKFLSSCAVLIGKTGVISDVHLGYEERFGMGLAPRVHVDEVVKKVEQLFSEAKINHLIINGDLKEVFGKVTDSEWRHAKLFFDTVKKHCKKNTIIKGNHDTFAGAIAKKQNADLKDVLVVKDCVILHGDMIPKNLEKHMKEKKLSTIIIGHEHPAITLEKGPKREIYKCFLEGKWKKYKLIVLPSFNPLVEGTDILKGKFLSPFLGGRNNFSVHVVGDEVYDFGKLKKLHRL